MDFKEGIIYSKPYYKLIKIKYIETIDIYLKFINWVAGEFDLFLQDESEGLKVYYPNGWLSIKSDIKLKTEMNLQITIVNKSKVVCEKTNTKLDSIYNHIYKNYSIIDD
ncbi:hypothetical protein [Thalassobellus citreus]|uniref:hypothetical protein n=1 Tax=Thalassobellus citreus TaxID=3367752 RepID=UPI0037A81D07